MKTIGITGGTGMVGSYVSKLLTARGYKVVILTRNTSGRAPKSGISYALWDASGKQCDTEAFANLDAVIHLAGEPVAAHRWTAVQKKKIADSRIEGTRFLAQMLATHAPKCTAVVAASAIGYYGPDGADAHPFSEDAPASNDFLGTTCMHWEAAEQQLATGRRLAIMRIGIVLANEGGAFPEFIKTAPLRALPIPGSGTQMISWIHIEDLVGMIVYALENDSMSGVYNAVAPHPVSCSRLLTEIATAKGGFFIKPKVPAWVLRLVLGELSIEVLKSSTVSSKRITDSGFTFAYPNIGSALERLLAHKKE